jgi:hypothetical protein
MDARIWPRSARVDDMRPFAAFRRCGQPDLTDERAGSSFAAARRVAPNPGDLAIRPARRIARGLSRVDVVAVPHQGEASSAKVAQMVGIGDAGGPDYFSM